MDDPFRRSSPISRAFTLGLRYTVGAMAAGVAFFNLLGLPMMEAHLMNPTVGWIAMGVALLCFFAPLFAVAVKR